MPATLTEEERDGFAEVLMTHYAQRVLAHLKALPLDQLQAVGNASPAEANANYHDYVSKQVEQHGAG